MRLARSSSATIVVVSGCVFGLQLVVARCLYSPTLWLRTAFSTHPDRLSLLMPMVDALLGLDFPLTTLA